MVLCAAILGVAAPNKADAGATRMEKRLVAKINDVRAARGLHTVRIGYRLERGAHRWAWYLLRADSFYHARLASGMSENLAWGTCSWLTPATVVRMWLNSSSHRTNLLDRSARYVGAGWAAGGWRSYRCVEMAVARFR